MTIDEQIKKCKKIAENERYNQGLARNDDMFWNELSCKKIADEHEQLAEWLEELKWYKSQFTYTEEVVNGMTQQAFDNGYNNAIDEFTKELRMYINNGEMNMPNIKNKMAVISNRIVDEIAEQLRQ